MSNQKPPFNNSTVSKQVATAVHESSSMVRGCVCVCEEGGGAEGDSQN